MKRFLGLLLSVVMLTGILAGCAGTPAENSGTSTPESSPATTDVSIPDDDKAEAAWPRTITDSKGNKIVLEKKPERIAVVFGYYAENFYALNEYPAGVTSIEFLDIFVTLQSFLTDATHPVENIGEILTPNVEKILELNPDLIITSEHHDEIYNELSKIAPVISITQSDVPTWKDKIRKIAEIVGKEDEAEAFITAVEKDTKAYREELDKKLDGETVLIIQAADKNTFYLRTPEYFSQFYDKENGLGLIAPDGYTNDTGKMSLEGLTELNPDHIFYMSDTEEKYKTVYEELSNNAVWNSLDAVKNDKIYFIDQGAISGGALAVRYGIDTVFEALSK